MQAAELKPCLVDGATVLRNDPGARTGIVFIDGSIPGVSPYCGGAHVWGKALAPFAGEGGVAVIDSLSALGSGDGAACKTLDGAKDRFLSILRALGLRRCHVVAHDVAGLAALLMACEAADLIAGVTVVSGGVACPTRDEEENLALAHPYAPRTHRSAQKWALERISYSHQHIDAKLLDACEAAARSAAWLDAPIQGEARSRWQGSVGRAKARLYQAARTTGVPVPVQLVWGTHDPLSSVEHGLTLFRILAEKQRAAHFHLLNRAGALPFREEAEGFHQAVAAFVDGTGRDDGPV